MVKLTRSKLTPGERFLLHRRRSGRSQRACAKALGVSLFLYRQMERDAMQPTVTPPSIGFLALHEQCVIARRRAGMSAGAVAKRLGMSLNWLSEIEHGRQSAQSVAQYWRAQKLLTSRAG